jgi:polyphosphate kinase
MTPVADTVAVDQLEEILALNLADDTQAWSLGPDGSWSRIATVVGVGTQDALIAAALERGSLVDESRRAGAAP